MLTHNNNTMDFLNFDFTTTDPEYLNNIKSKIMSEQTKVYDQVASFSGERNYNNTILPLESVGDFCTIQAHSINYLTNFHVSKEIRDKGTEIETELAKHGVELSMRKDMYDAFNTYYNGVYNVEKAYLSAEKNKCVNDTNICYKRMGMNLPKSERDEIQKIKEQISELSNNFQNNVNNENTKINFTKTQLNGVPDSWFDSHTPIDGTEDTYELTLKPHDFITVMDNCKNRQTRHDIAKISSRKCVDENSPIFKEILGLRTELANKLGYKTFADYNCELNILNTGDKIMEFENNLHDILKDQYVTDIDNVKKFALTQDNDTVESFESYDTRYYDKLYKETHCDFDSEEVRKYLPLDNVIEKMFSIFQSILGLSFIKTENDNVWHSTVQFYQVIDSSTLENIGYFYLDLFPREGKFQHFAIFPLSGGFETSDNQYFNSDSVPSVGCMACNFPENETLKFDDVITLLHEFGHMMHLLCCNTKLSVNTSFGVTIDFVETPSQLLEFWAYSPKVLKFLTKHVDTGESIPDELMEKLYFSEKLNKSIHYIGQLFYGCVDIKVHTLTCQEARDIDPAKVFAETKKEFTGFDVFEGSNGFSSFCHLISGYCAGYYSYLRSEAYSANLYHRAFKGHEFDKEVGMRYRKIILERGSSLPERDIMVEFLGEELDDKYFVDGLKIEQNTSNNQNNMTESV
jgi:Zn-dependent oligopeptidase